MRDPHLTEALMPFGEHLDELRKRLIYALVGIVPIFIVALVFGQSLLAFLIQPLRASQKAAGLPQEIVMLGVLEGFNTYLKVSFIATIVVGAPWILYQFWLFVAPGLYLKERRFVHILTPMSVLLTAGGIAFMLKVMLPVMLLFFVTFGLDIMPHENTVAPAAEITSPLPVAPLLNGDPEKPELGAYWVNLDLRALRIVAKDSSGTPVILEVPLTRNSVTKTEFRLSDYIGFILGMALAFAVAFQMPVAVLLLGWVGIIEPKTLTRYRRHAIFACGVVGAIVTPTGDPLSMFLLAGPLYLLYELGLIMLRLLPVSRIVKSAEAKEAAAAKKRAQAKSGDPTHAPGQSNGQVTAQDTAAAAGEARRSEPDADDEGP